MRIPHDRWRSLVAPPTEEEIRIRNQKKKALRRKIAGKKEKGENDRFEIRRKH